VDGRITRISEVERRTTLSRTRASVGRRHRANLNDHVLESGRDSPLLADPRRSTLISKRPQPSLEQMFVPRYVQPRVPPTALRPYKQARAFSRGILCRSRGPQANSQAALRAFSQRMRPEMRAAQGHSRRPRSSPKLTVDGEPERSSWHSRSLDEHLHSVFRTHRRRDCGHLFRARLDRRSARPGEAAMNHCAA
jgi:hypothetical protein